MLFRVFNLILRAQSIIDSDGNACFQSAFTSALRMHCDEMGMPVLYAIREGLNKAIVLVNEMIDFEPRS